MILDKHNPYKNGALVKYDESKNIYFDCTLNQTDIKTNANKFYIIQMCKIDTGYAVYIRYGRVGIKGTVRTSTYTDKSSAIAFFKKQYRSKTGNTWGSSTFTKKKGKYFLADISYEDELSKINEKDMKSKKIPKSKLSQRVQKFIQMISNIEMMNESLVELDIDTKKMPLGKITSNQIDKAREILKKISNETDNDIITDLSSDYYTYIPTACGMRKPPIIDNDDIITKYNKTLDELADIVVGVNIIKNSAKNVKLNPIDNIYNDIDTEIKALAKNTNIYKNLVKFVQNTHGPTHGQKLEVLDILKVAQNGKCDAYNNYSENIDNKMLLFHGTPQSCVLSIFKKDFYLDPSKLGVQIAGKMFGYGVYFADCATKSFNYTRAGKTGDVGCLLIAEVALGNISERTNADSSISKVSLQRINCDSTKGIGRYAPVEYTEIKGVKIPNGEIKDIRRDVYLRYNEYIVYDINQICIKYVMVVKNNGNYSGW